MLKYHSFFVSVNEIISLQTEICYKLWVWKNWNRIIWIGGKEWRNLDKKNVTQSILLCRVYTRIALFRSDLLEQRIISRQYHYIGWHYLSAAITKLCLIANVFIPPKGNGSQVDFCLWGTWGTWGTTCGEFFCQEAQKRVWNRSVIYYFYVEQLNASIRLLPYLRLHRFHLHRISSLSFNRRNTAMLIDFHSSFPTTSTYCFLTVKPLLATSISTV